MLDRLCAAVDHDLNRQFETVGLRPAGGSGSQKVVKKGVGKSEQNPQFGHYNGLAAAGARRGIPRSVGLTNGPPGL